VVVGDGRHFPSALVVPDLKLLAARLQAAPPTVPDAARALVARPDAQALFAAIVEAVNEKLAQFERIKKFTVLSSEFSMDTGELTPTLKVKRRVIEERYRDVIDGMYR